MKEVSQIKRIYEGFFGDEVSEDVAKKRRDLCGECSFNSVNNSDLKLVEKIRNQFTGPFCVLCSCQIHEKTGSPLEECAIHLRGEPKKWNKIKLETMEKTTLDLTQNTDYEMSIERDDFVINMGKVSETEHTEMALTLTPKDGMILYLQNVEVSCGCVSTKTTGRPNFIQIQTKVNLNQVSYGSNIKSIIVHYDLDGKISKQKIKLKFFKV